VNSTEISEFNSASAAEKLLFKTALRVCEYLACQAAAGA
jgi:DNA-binding Xre family transcriptional regulator